MIGEALSYTVVNLPRPTKYGLYLVFQTRQWHAGVRGWLQLPVLFKWVAVIVWDQVALSPRARVCVYREVLGCVPRRGRHGTGSCVSRWQGVLMFLGCMWGQTGAVQPPPRPEHPCVGDGQGCRGAEETRACWRCLATLPGCFRDFNKSDCPQHSPAAYSCTFACWPTARCAPFVCFSRAISLMNPAWIFEETVDFLEI